MNSVKDALEAGADNLVVGRAITALNDAGHTADEFLEPLDREEIGQSGDMADMQSPAPAFQHM
jgi:bifunctional enzyme Fae/Hps